MHRRTTAAMAEAFGALRFGVFAVGQVQMQMNARSATLLTDDERNTLVEQLPARCANQTQAFQLLTNAVSGWNAHIEVNQESLLLSIEHAGHVVVCTVPPAKNANGRMCVKLKWEQGSNAMVWIGICADLRNRLNLEASE
jgi:hypothetical protein